MQRNNQPSEDLQSYFDQIKKDLSLYLTKRLEWFKLSSYEKSAKASSHIMYGLIVFSLILVILLIGLLALGFLLGDIFGSYAFGFGILVGVSVIVLFIFMACAKRFRRFISNKVITVIRKIERDED